MWRHIWQSHGVSGYIRKHIRSILYLIGLIGLQAPAPVLGQDLQRLQFRPGVRPGVRSNTATTGDRFGSDLLGGFRPPKARRKEVHRRKATSGYRVFWLLEYLSATGQLTISGTGHRHCSFGIVEHNQQSQTGIYCNIFLITLTLFQPSQCRQICL